MTSVEQQAVEVIADHILPVTEGKAESEGLSGDRLGAVAQSRAVRNARGAVRALADAGLLAPGLPDHIETIPDNMPGIYTNGGHVYAVLNNGYDSDWECLDPSEATEFALRMLAAAKYAEEEK